MDLREFVAESLVQIQEGIQDAIERRGATAASAGTINPIWRDIPSRSWADHVQNVEFDVAVTVVDKTSTEGKAGLKIVSVAEVGGGLSKGEEHTTVSRIKFTVPIVPPAQIANAAI